MTVVKLALDWTPNTLHAGLFCALEKGIYRKHGLEVHLLPPDADYSRTPTKRLQNDEVDLAICPSESVIAYNETGRMKLQAIYAILQKDVSAIVSTKLEDIKDLQNGMYGSYNAKYEDDIVKAMVNHAGGDGGKMQIQRSTGKLSLFEEVKRRKLDAAWVFMPWEGLEAEMEGVKIHAFKPGDYNIPYGYSPVIARDAGKEMDGEVLRRFVAATVEGYGYSVEHGKVAAEAIHKYCPGKSVDFLERSLVMLEDFFQAGASSKLGVMEAEKWEAWTRWLKDRELLKKDLATEDLFTNEFFQ